MVIRIAAVGDVHLDEDVVAGSGRHLSNYRATSTRCCSPAT